MSKNKRVKLKGQLKSYVQWPLSLTILLVVMNIAIYMTDLKAGLIMSAFVGLYTIIALILYFYNRPLIMNELISFATQYGQVQKKLLEDLSIPYLLLDDSGKVIWMNRKGRSLVQKDKHYQKSITSLFPTLTKEVLPLEGEEDESTVHLTYDERDYRVDMRRVTLENLSDAASIIDTGEYEGHLVAVYFFDETDINRYIRENQEQRLVAGLIYLDNYDEALESVEEVRRSLLIALIDRKINKYISELDGIVKKMEKDKYFVVLKYKYLSELQNNKFSLLEEVKGVNIGNEMAVTLSIGMGANGESFIQNYEYSRVAIDLALGRGGDQAVVKDGGKISYYGGKSKQIEKNTRVKARVKAHALREIMETKDKVIVMGHKISDVDSFGAAIGIYRAAQVLNKRAYIVLNDITSSVRPLRDLFKQNKDYQEEMFVNSERALEIVDNNTVVVVVDTSKPSYTECQELLEKKGRTIVVLDHHRQSSEVIDNAVLSYIEPFASSACEMVAEILQYFDDGVRIKSVEADCLYAGIIIDTNNFLSKTGVRTFEAAAYLRRCGADVTRVRKLFRDDMKTYKARAEAVRHAEVYQDCYAISVCPSEDLDSPTVVGAQAANELLNITGVKASFVLTDYNDKIYVSARSIDEVNVQIIMERLGGGGHLGIAGAQLTGCTIEEARDIIKQTLCDMIKEGDL